MENRKSNILEYQETDYQDKSNNIFKVKETICCMNINSTGKCRTIIKSVKLNYYTKDNYNLKSEVEEFLRETFKNKLETLTISKYEEFKYLCIVKSSDYFIRVDLQVILQK